MASTIGPARHYDAGFWQYPPAKKNARAWSTERRNHSLRRENPRRPRPISPGRVAFRRSTRGDFCPRGRASGCGRGPPGPPIRPAFTSLHPHRVQPSKAVPRSRDGRLPRASRCRGYKPRQQARRTLPASAVSCRTPLAWGKRMDYMSREIEKSRHEGPFPFSPATARLAGSLGQARWRRSRTGAKHLA